MASINHVDNNGKLTSASICGKLQWFNHNLLTKRRVMIKGSPTKIKYLTNKDLLEEIHVSKKSYCEFVDIQYSNYDIIVNDLNKITQESLDDARKKRVTQETIRRKKEMIAQGIKNPVVTFSIDDVPQESIVIRLMTFDHIPINEEKVGKAKTVADKHIKCNFPPFQHYIIKDDEFVCVGKSHWTGGIENGWFCVTHGKMTNRLAMMFMKLVERYGHRGNWRGYTYLDEMKNQALLQLSQIGLQFDESRSETPNPFAYYTAAITNSFTRVLNIEKKNQNIRDDLLTMHGATPSYTRQTEADMKRLVAASVAAMPPAVAPKADTDE